MEPKIWEAARATSAATTFFDPITTGKYGQEFIDGGAEQNNPIQEAHDEVLSNWQNRDIQCIVSVGTGLSQLEAFGDNLYTVGKTLINIATETDKTASLFARTHPQYPQYDQPGEGKRLFRFQVAQGLDKVGIDEHEKIKEIASATQIYMENGEQVGNKQLKAFQSLILKTRE